ncbi:cleavage and polyadenylation specificity factor subunit 1 isoform X1 [Tanacetum coccineum]|uniref:Cleavage and polyadenylation specificity factor subunit 1 isoform X1 n=1 Tax=Tanacetum coccineum TaxID=301880 RepID=A0ABQ5AUB4_9ASTR
MPGNLPHDAYKLLAVPSPIGGVLVVCANTIHYHSQSASCILALNNYAVPFDSSQEMSRSSFSVELDAANATWLSNNVAMLSTKSGELLLLTLVHDGRIVQKLDLSKSKASVLTSEIHHFDEDRMRKMPETVSFKAYLNTLQSKEGMEQEIVRIKGNLYSTKVQTFNDFVTFLNLIKNDEIISQEWDYFRNRFNKMVKWFFNHYLERSLPGSIPPTVNGDGLLVQFHCGAGSPLGVKEEVGDIEGDLPSTKRLRRSSSDALQDMANDEELSLYGSDLNNGQSSQKTFSFTVRDSLINVGPLKDFSYGLRMNADPNATGVAKQSNYELVCCSGHGKNGALCVLQRSIRPEIITQEAIPGCKGLWTVYHKNSRNPAEQSKTAAEDDEHHAYLIISLESRTMVLQTVSNLEEVTEHVDYFVQGRTIYAGNLFGRRRVIQVYSRGARILDGAFMTQDLNFRATNSEAAMTVSSVSIADPYVLLMMTDGTIQLLVGGTI